MMNRRPTRPFPWNMADAAANATGRTPVVVEGVLATVVHDEILHTWVFPEHPDAHILYVHHPRANSTRSAEMYGHNMYHTTAAECGATRPVDVVQHLVDTGDHTVEVIVVGDREAIVVMAIEWELLGDEPYILLSTGRRTSRDDPRDQRWRCPDVPDLDIDDLPPPPPEDEAARRAEASTADEAIDHARAGAASGIVERAPDDGRNVLVDDW